MSVLRWVSALLLVSQLPLLSLVIDLECMRTPNKAANAFCVKSKTQNPQAQGDLAGPSQR